MGFFTNEPELRQLCLAKTPAEIFEYATGNQPKGIDIISFKGIETRKQLPDIVVNVLLLYFYDEFAGKVYNRTYLTRVYNNWVSKFPVSYEDAMNLANIDIKTLVDTF
ncbi:hypothetical protein [Falsibacillus pallidus]|uniref:hypothetical protein n=1 Tax=Falsibacillus pallidus TaxID=493781 RepID=UPI003D974727